MKRLFEQCEQVVIVTLLTVCTFCMTGCNGSSGGKRLIAEPVEGEQTGQEEIDIHRLFEGGIVPLAKYSGVVDPVGTTIDQDLDGDGITNDKEGLSNAWVADYPVLETYIAPPVTMKIEVLFHGEDTSSTITSEISATDVVSTLDRSTENAHREEVNLRTVQFRDSIQRSTASEYNNEHESNRSTGVSTYGSFLGTGGGKTDNGSNPQQNQDQNTPQFELYGGSLGYNYSRQSSKQVSNSYTNSYGHTTTMWKNIPFKNDLNRHATNIKRDAAARNAHSLRRELNNRTRQVEKITPNAGYVRAAFYITNDSVNMPVRLSNILCSFMMEAPDGQLIPVQSFRLRNDDYSLFDVELYGGSTFGPYVIELKGLNTVEIREAIAKGYNPKIFIVNYEMSHVADSNYRDLLNDTLDVENLKIIEENSKGRTAGVKIVGPNLRRFFRVAAFDTDGIETRTGVSLRSGDLTGQVDVKPGVNLEKALDRIAFSGLDVQYGFYMLDFTGIEPEMKIKRFIVRGIKSINGIETKIPGITSPLVTGDLAGIDYDGNPDPTGIEVYIMKPVARWTENDYDNFKMWTVFADGKFFMYSADLVQTDPDGELVLRTFNYNGEDIPVIEGVQSTIWPGDHYDIVYLDLTEYLELVDDFGNNPIEKVTTLKLNTRWDLSDYGDNPAHHFYPDMNSYYLGDAGLGDAIRFDITLDRSGYLYPSFGMGTDDEVDSILYNDFSYRVDESLTYLLDSVNKYTLDEAIDLQISLGLDGKMGDWVNLVPGKNLDNGTDNDIIYYGTDRDQIMIIDRNWDFMTQEYSLTIQLPYELRGVADDQLVSIYMRTAPHNVYREIAWPVPNTKIRKFRGYLAATVHNDNRIIVKDTSGAPELNDQILICTSLECTPYTINGIVEDQDTNIYEISLDLSDTEKEAFEHFAGESVYIDHDTAPGIGATVAVNYNFIGDWNSQTIVPMLDSYLVISADYADHVPLVTEAGFNNPYLNYCDDLGLGLIETNWAGGDNYNNPNWNSWGDAALFYNNDFSLTSTTLLTTDTESLLKLNFSGVTDESQIKKLFFKAPLLERNYTVQARFVDYRAALEEGE